MTNNLPQLDDFKTINVKIKDNLDTPLKIEHIELTKIFDKSSVMIDFTIGDNDTVYTSYIMDRQIRRFLLALNEGNHLPIILTFYLEPRENNRMLVKYA